jgi:hypothetical protein
MASAAPIHWCGKAKPEPVAVGDGHRRIVSELEHEIAGALGRLNTILRPSWDAAPGSVSRQVI